MLFLRPFRFLAEAFTEQSTPRRMALGFAMGMVVGLVPKGNLTAVALLALACGTRVNLGAAMLSAFLFSWVGFFADPWTHRLGHLLLTSEPLAPLWIELYDMPVVPWTDFNNTVVLGSLLGGLMLFYPAYRFSRPIFARLMPPLEARLRRFKLVQLLRGSELAGHLGRV